MNLRDKLKGLVGEASGMAQAAAGREFTAEEADRLEAIAAESEGVKAQIERDRKAREVLGAITAADDAGETSSAKAHHLAGAEYTDRTEAADLRSFGDQFVKSAGYEAFRKAYPSGAGSGSPIDTGRVGLGSLAEVMPGRKATLTTAIGRIQTIRQPTVDVIDRPVLSLLDLIARGSMAGAFEYVQITGVTRGAAIVAEGELKPLSDMTTALADCKPYTYADGFDVTNQLLSDAPAMATFLQSELKYNLETKIESVILDGSGTNGTPAGIRHTSGVQAQPFDTDMVTTVRKAITRVTKLGGTVTAVLMSPEDDEAWDLLQDANGRYMGAGPFQSGPGTAWGRPRVVSERLSGTGEFILGDFRTVALLDREGLAVQAFNQHKDYAQRNMVYVRAELRAGQAIWRPNRLVIGQSEA